VRCYVFVVVWGDELGVDKIADVAGEGGVDGGAELDAFEAAALSGLGVRDSVFGSWGGGGVGLLE
jgi:hypothetical protein